MSPNKIFRIATRGSKLAVLQANQVKDVLLKHYPTWNIELVTIITAGDRIRNKPLYDIGGKALFSKALEHALLNGKADIAVHSLKDLPPELSNKFCIAAVSEREYPHDVFISDKYPSLKQLPKHAKVGTCSPRRIAELLRVRDDLEIILLRGNVDSRIRKLKDSMCDAIILAQAGLQRLGLTKHITEILPMSDFLPAAGQGVMAIECLANATDLISKMNILNHQDTLSCITAERSVNLALNANCHSAVASFASLCDETKLLTLQSMALSKDGSKTLYEKQTDKVINAESIGKAVAARLLQQGARELLGITK